MLLYILPYFLSLPSFRGQNTVFPLFSLQKLLNKLQARKTFVHKSTCADREARIHIQEAPASSDTWTPKSDQCGLRGQVGQWDGQFRGWPEISALPLITQMNSGRSSKTSVCIWGVRKTGAGKNWIWWSLLALTFCDLSVSFLAFWDNPIDV